MHCELYGLAMASQILPTDRYFQDLFGLRGVERRGKASPWIDFRHTVHRIYLYGIVLWIMCIVFRQRFYEKSSKKAETVVSVAEVSSWGQIFGRLCQTARSILFWRQANAHALLGTFHFKKSITYGLTCLCDQLLFVRLPGRLHLRNSYYYTMTNIVLSLG